MVVYYELTFLVSVICLISFFFMKNLNFVSEIYIEMKIRINPNNVLEEISS